MNSGRLRRIAKCFPEVIDDLVQPAIEIDEGAGSPQPACQFLAGDEFAWLLQERQQQLESLVAERSSASGVAQLAGPRIERERPKPKDAHPGHSLFHRVVPTKSVRKSITGESRFHRKGTAGRRLESSPGETVSAPLHWPMAAGRVDMKPNHSLYTTSTLCALANLMVTSDFILPASTPKRSAR